MEKQEKIPLLQFSELTSFYTRALDWTPFATNTKLEYFHINRLETHILNSPILPHRKPLFDFLLVKKGNSIRSKGLTRYEFGESCMFFLPAFQVTQYDFMSKDTEGYFCHFDERIFHFLPKNFLNDQYPFFQFQAHPVIYLSETAMSNIEAILERLLVVYGKEGIKKSFIAAYLLPLFEEVKNELAIQPQKVKNAAFQITESYKNELVKHIYEKQTVTAYAKLLNITPNYLNKCTINTMNKTAQELLNDMLILEAKTLIKYSNLQMAEIAVKLRNQTPSNFARFFKSQTGFTPKEYAELS